MSLRDTFATNLRKARHTKGLTQEALAFDVGMDRTHLSEIENGKVAVGLDLIEKLAVVLEIDPWELLKPDRKRS